MEIFLDYIAKLAGLLVGAAIAYLAKVAGGYIKEKRLQIFVNSLVKAAEQLYDKEIDDTGEIRLAYVESMVEEAGYVLDGAIRAYIESKVYDLNSEQKKNN